MAAELEAAAEPGQLSVDPRRRPAPGDAGGGVRPAGIMVRAYQGDGVRITVADPASNDRVLRVLAAQAA